MRFPSTGKILTLSAEALRRDRAALRFIDAVMWATLWFVFAMAFLG